MSDKFDFNKGLKELEEIVQKMESTEINLDEMLKNFEKGIKLSRKCQQSLDKAQQKITVLTDENDYQ